MEIREADALGAEAVHVWRLEDGIAVRGEVAVTLIVGEDEEDVGLPAGDGRGKSVAAKNAKERKDENASRQKFHIGVKRGESDGGNQAEIRRSFKPGRI